MLQYHLAAIEFDVLSDRGIKGIILDLDNTIVSEDDRYISPYAELWIEEAKSRNFQLFLLSNGKRRHRVSYWSYRLRIPAISPARKPFPLSLYRALKFMGLKKRQVLVVGDSWHTDILGAMLFGCSWIQVASLPHPARWWEKLFGRWLQVPYPPGFILWETELTRRKSNAIAAN